MENNNTQSTEDKINPHIETLSGDILDMALHNEAGVIHGIIKEEEEKAVIDANISPTSHRNKILISLSVLFVLLSILLLYSFIYFNKKNSTVPASLRYQPLIYTDEFILLPIDGLSKKDIQEKIFSDVKNSNIESGKLKAYYLTINDKTVPLDIFLKNIEANISKETIEQFNPSYLIGAIGDAKESIFILLKPNSFASVFPGMKLWENKMFYDLSALYNIEVNKDTSYLLTKNFEDGFIQNKNARILYDNEGGIILAYIYLDNNSILITNTNLVAKEILVRLSGSSLRK